MIAGGSNYIERHEITATYESLIEAAIKFEDYEAAAKLQQKMTEHLSTYDEFTATHNTLRVYAEAHAIGSFFDRISGWIDLKVYPIATYIGNPNPQIFRSQIKREVPIIDRRQMSQEESPVQIEHLPKPIQISPSQSPTPLSPSGKMPVKGEKIIRQQAVLPQ